MAISRGVFYRALNIIIGIIISTFETNSFAQPPDPIDLPKDLGFHILKMMSPQDQLRLSTLSRAHYQFVRNFQKQNIEISCNFIIGIDDTDLKSLTSALKNLSSSLRYLASLKTANPAAYANIVASVDEHLSRAFAKILRASQNWSRLDDPTSIDALYLIQTLAVSPVLPQSWISKIYEEMTGTLAKNPLVKIKVRIAQVLPLLAIRSEVSREVLVKMLSNTPLFTEVFGRARFALILGVACQRYLDPELILLVRKCTKDLNLIWRRKMTKQFRKMINPYVFGEPDQIPLVPFPQKISESALAREILTFVNKLDEIDVNQLLPVLSNSLSVAE